MVETLRHLYWSKDSANLRPVFLSEYLMQEQDMGCLYKLTSPSGKSYIGITIKTFEERWAKHIEHAMGKRANGALYAALRKYGPDAFRHEVLAECDDWSRLCKMEIQAIKEHGTL